MIDSYGTFMFPHEEVRKIYNKVIAQYGMTRKGFSQMTDAKRAELRKKRKKKKK